MKFNGKLTYFLKNTDQYGLSKNLPKNLTEEDFTFCVSVKVDWKKMKPNDLTRNGGIICKSGMHIGLIAIKTENDCLINATGWYTKDGENHPVDISFAVDEDEKILNLAFIYERASKKITLIKNKQIKTAVFDGELIDYNHSWVWIGCSNAFDGCDVEHRNFFRGDIKLLGIFKRALQPEHVDKFFEDGKLNHAKEFSIVVHSNFKEHTPYKVKDQSGQGNHLIKYVKEWF